MAIDPRLSLAYVPPQIDWSRVDPYAREQRRLTLQGLMDQQTVRQLQIQQEQMQMEQARRILEERRGLAEFLKNYQTTPSATTAFAPTQSPLAPGTGNALPLPSPDASTGVPLSTEIAGVPSNAFWMPNAAPAAPQISGMPQNAFWNQTLAPQPVPAAPVVRQTVTVGTPVARTGFPQLDYVDLYRRFPNIAGAFIDQVSKANKASLEEQEKRIDLLTKQNDAKASIAQTVRDEATKVQAVAKAYANKLINEQERDQLMSHPYDPKEWNDWINESLKNTEFLNNQRENVRLAWAAEDQKHKRALYGPQEDQARSEAMQKDLATAGQLMQGVNDQAAWDVVRPIMPASIRDKLSPTFSQPLKQSVLGMAQSVQAGTTTPFAADVMGQKESLATVSQRTPKTPEVEAQEIRIAAAKDAAQAKLRQLIDGMTPAQANLVSGIATRYDNHPLVKDYNIIANKYGVMRALLDRKMGGPGDLAIVYDFMKSLDPNSVVRESEYATAAKSGNIFAGAFAKFNGLLKPEGGFLPDNVKKDFLDIVGSRMGVARKQIGDIYQDYGRRIDKISGRPGTGTDYLTNYGELYGSTTGGASGKIATTDQIKAYAQKHGISEEAARKQAESEGYTVK